jgi:hypothetical protein
MPSSNPHQPTEDGGGWLSWWTGPAITSGGVLLAVLLGAAAFGAAVSGFIVFSAGLPAVGLLCVVIAGVFGWAAYRVLRRSL